MMTLLGGIYFITTQRTCTKLRVYECLGARLLSMYVPYLEILFELWRLFSSVLCFDQEFIKSFMKTLLLEMKTYE